MGNQKSTLNEVSGEKQYINHPRFQNVKIITKQNDKFIKIQIPLHTEKQFQDWTKGLKLIQKFEAERLFSSTHHQFVKQGFCSSGGILTLLYENYPYILRDEITNRKSIQKKFEESQLWYLLFTIVSVAKDFSTLNTKVGDIRSDNIFINQEGQVKLAHIYSWPSEQNNYFKKLINQQKTFLSPQEMIEIQNNVQSAVSDELLSQSFSIGITLLQAGLLEDLRPIYSKTKFQLQSFTKFLNMWKNSEYSSFLKETIIGLCQFDFNKRKKSTEVYQSLLPHQEDIKNLKQFTKITTNQTQFMQNNKIVENQYEQLVKSQLIPQFSYQTTTINPQYTSSIARNEYTNIKPSFQQNIVHPQYQTQSYQRVNYQNHPIITYGQPISQAPNLNNYPNSQTTSSFHQPQPYTIPGNTIYHSGTVLNTIPTVVGNKIPYYQPSISVYQNENIKPSQAIQIGSSTQSKNDTLSKIDEQILLSKQRFP